MAVGRTKLAGVHVDAFSETVVDLVRVHISRLGISIEAHLFVEGRSIHGELSGLGDRARLLATFARDGGDLSGTMLADVEEAFVAVCQALFSQAGDPQPFELEDALSATMVVRRSHGYGDLELVMVAGGARLKLAHGSMTGLRSSELAALSGVHPDEVREEVRSGRLPSRWGAVDVSDAVRWLADKGVPGLPSRHGS